MSTPATPPTTPVPPKPSASTVVAAVKPTVTTVAQKLADPTKSGTLVAKGPAFTITSMEEAVSYINMLVYAQYGAGKTTLCGSSADVEEMGDVLMLDFESGKMTLQNNSRITRKDRLDVIHITSFKQLGEVHKFLKQHCRLRDNPKTTEEEMIKHQAAFMQVDPKKIRKARRYNTVIIDSLSELDTLSMYELLGIDSDYDLNDVMNDGDVDVAEWAEFRKNNQIIQLVIRAYRDLPMNALFVCHAAFIQDEKKRMLYSPALTGKLAKQVQGFVDIVGYLMVGEIPADSKSKEAPRRLMLQPTGKFDAKCRVASFKDSYLDNPVMQDVWDLVHENDE